MDDLDRLFTYLVKHLAATAPERLYKPFQISELYQRLIPYRMHRRELGFEAVEDYEVEACLATVSAPERVEKLEEFAER